MCAAALTVSLSACSTLPDEAQCPTAERAVEYITRQVPDALLIECLPRLRQADVNPSGTPSIAVVVIRTNNGRLDECIKLHELLVSYILRGHTMPGDTKPDLPVKQQNQKDQPADEKEAE